MASVIHENISPVPFLMYNASKFSNIIKPRCGRFPSKALYATECGVLRDGLRGNEEALGKESIPE
jgi:hypothetical protein